MKFAFYILFLFISLSANCQSDVHVRESVDRIISWSDVDWEFDLHLSLDSLEWAREVSHDNKWKKREVKVLSKLTQFMLKKLNNYERASFYVGEIKKISSKNPENAELKSIYHNMLGVLYYHEGIDRKRALIEFEKSIQIAQEDGVKPSYSSTNNYALVLINEGKYDAALKMLDNTKQSFLEVFSNEKASELFSLNYLNRGICYIYKGVPDSVIYCFQKSLEYASMAKKEDGVFRAKVYLGVYSQESGDYDKAIEYFNGAKEFLNTPFYYSDKILLFESIADCYMNKGDFEMAHNNRKLQVMYLDSLKSQGYSQQAFSLDYKFELDSIRFQREVASLNDIAEKRKIEYQIIIGISLFALMLLIAVFIIYRLNKLKQISFIRLKNEELENERIKQRAELEIFRKEEELIQANVELSVQKNELQTLKSKLKSHLEKSYDPEFDDLKHFLKQVNKSERKSEQLKYLDHVLNFSNNSFYIRLREKHPNLSEDEMRLVTLIRLNLSSEELVLIFNISSASLMTKRYRLRKKLNLKKDESLENVIVNI